MGVRDPLQPSSEVTAGEAPGMVCGAKASPEAGQHAGQVSLSTQAQGAGSAHLCGTETQQAHAAGSGACGEVLCSCPRPSASLSVWGTAGGSNAEGRLLPPALSRTVSTGKRNALQSVPQHLPEPGCFAHSHLRLSPTAVPSSPEERPAMCAGLCPGRSVCLQA